MQSSCELELDFSFSESRGGSFELRQGDVALTAGGDDLFAFTFRTTSGKSVSAASTVSPACARSSTHRCHHSSHASPHASIVDAQTDLGTSCTVQTLHTVDAEGFKEPQISKVRVEYALVKCGKEARVLLVRGTVHFADSFHDLMVLSDHFALLRAQLDISSPPEPEQPSRLNLIWFTLMVAVPLVLVVIAAHSRTCIWLVLVAAAACAYAILSSTSLSDGLSNGGAFFVNGWQAWSFCGVVKRGGSVPPYRMPSSYVRAFHAGTRALDINLASSTLFHWLFASAGEMHIASDLFTVIANTVTNEAACLGFLSQKNQFGYIASDRSYSRVAVGCECDGARACAGETLRTDWLMVELQPHAHSDVLALYYSLAGAYATQFPIDQSTTPASPAPATTTPVSPAPSSACSSSSSDSLVSVPVGWCSWYHFFDKVSERDLHSNIATLTQIQRDLGLPDNLLFQIDDGYQDAWGDWLSLSLSRFPSQSMPDVVRAIKAAGMRPGVWAAPFACDHHSQLAKDHPDWLLKRKGSSTVKANSANCGKWFYGLDVTHPEVQNFVLNTLQVAVHEWGFTYLKLDFLYAAALEHSQQGYHNPHLTRAQAMQVGLDLIHRARGENVFLLGCGAPLGSVIGRVHANRISADAGLSWNPSFPLPSSDAWNLPCARNMIRNTVCRLGMHGRWWINDPDCILLRSTTQFSEQEIIGIASVKAMSGGSIIISDDLAAVSKQRLNVVQSILPALGVAAVPIDLLHREMPEVLRLELGSEWALSDGSTSRQKWVVMALCNWAAASRVHAIDVRHVLDAEGLALVNSGSEVRIAVFDFWNQKVLSLSTADTMNFSLAIPADVPLNSALLLAFRPIIHRNRPLYLGSNLHFSCGKEISSCEFASMEKGGEVVVDVFTRFMMNASYESMFWFFVPHSHFECGTELHASMGSVRCEVVEGVGFGRVLKVSHVQFEELADANIRRFRFKL